MKYERILSLIEGEIKWIRDNKNAGNELSWKAIL